MTVDDFLLRDPCIEEIEGFISGLEAQKRFTPDAHAALTTRIAELKKGDRVPCNSDLPRLWHYDLGKKAVPFTAVERAILERRVEANRAARLAIRMEDRRKGVRRP